MAKRVNLSESQVESLLIEMEAEDEMGSNISNGIVRFEDEKEQEDTNSEICSNTALAESLMEEIEKLDRKIQVMPKYIKTCDAASDDKSPYTKMNS